MPTRAQQLLAEGVGTASLVFVGAGSVAILGTATKHVMFEPWRRMGDLLVDLAQSAVADSSE